MRSRKQEPKSTYPGEGGTISKVKQWDEHNLGNMNLARSRETLNS